MTAPLEVRVAGFAEWRTAARALLRAGHAPERVVWRAADDAQLGLGGVLATTPPDDPRPAADGPRVPRRFVELAALAAANAADDRWALLYRVLWRLAHGEPHLMSIVVDPDVHRLLRYEKAVRRDIHKTHAFVRFREVEGEGMPHFVAWYEPEHATLELSAPFFARRFPNMRWSILGPRRCAHWDGERLVYGAGVPRETAPAGDALETLWRTYYASIFNPARPKPGAMRAEMPRRVWHLLPEAALVPELLADAPRRVRRMIEAEARPPQARRPTRHRDDPQA